MKKISGSCLIAMLGGVAPAWGQGLPSPGWNMYQGNTSLEIRYTGDALNSVTGGTYSNHPAFIDIGILGNTITGMTIDTGSTGIAIASNLLPSLSGYKPLGPGTINYDSSGVSPSGTFYELPVTLLGGTSGGIPATGTTTVKVLVVTNESSTKYFGIGNNRNNVYSGAIDPSLTFAQNVAQGILKPISAVGMNPLLDVSVNDTALPNQGYVVMNDRIVVGLTTANNGYAFVKLMPDPANGPNLWNGIPVSLAVGSGATPAAGTILHDTGIDYAFLTPFGQTGEIVGVAMPGAPPTGAFYSFPITRGTSQPPATPCVTTPSATMTPCHVEGSTSTTRAFLNTGRQFYAGFNYLFDPVNGFAGYALSDSGLSTTATLSPLLALTGTVALSNGFTTDFETFLMGNTVLSQSGTGTFSGAISGPGGLTVSGGRVNLTGANTYTGGTTVSGGGILAIDANARMGDSASGLKLDGGTLLPTGSFTLPREITIGAAGGTFDTNGFDLTLGTPVTGRGGLAKNGLGILTLSGANSHAGGTTLNAGTLQLAPGASLPTTGPLAVNGGILDLNGNSLAIGSLSGLGGRIELGSGTLAIAEQGNTSFAGILAGTGGLTMQGPGVLSLAGVNTYTGPTNVTSGRLAINGSITSDVTVGAGGSLGGSGTVTGTVNVLGAAAPGNSIGTLNVVGSLTHAAGSSFQVETNGAGQADRINVTGAPGTTTIAGGTVTLTGASGVYAPSTTYTILNATGGVTGTFANATSLFPFLQPSLSYDANNVFLTLKPGGFGAGAGTANQAAVGRVLDASVAGASGDLATVIGTIAAYPLAQGQAALNALSGQNYSGFGTANLGGGLLFMNSLGQQMGLTRGGFGAGTRVALAQACETSLASADTCDGAASPWSLWGSALGGTGRIAGTANAGTLTYNAGGFATGVDYRFDPRFLAGIAVGFSSGNQWASGFSGQGTTSSYQASLYASFVQGAFYLDGMAGYGYSDNWMTRQIALPNLAVRTAQGRTGANQFLGQVEAGYRIGLHEPAALSVTPFARFQGITNNQYGFSESGAGALSLTVAPQTTGSARSVLGAEFAGAFGAEGREKLAVQMRLGWAHEYADTARPVTAAFAGAPGANFTVFGAAPQRDTATLSLAANTAVAQGVSLYARYDGEVGNGVSSHALNGGLRVNW